MVWWCLAMNLASWVFFPSCSSPALFRAHSFALPWPPDCGVAFVTSCLISYHFKLGLRILLRFCRCFCLSGCVLKSGGLPKGPFRTQNTTTIVKIVNYYAVVLLLRPPNLVRRGPFFERKNVCNSQENGVRTRCATTVNHPAVLKILRVVHLLPVVFLVRQGPLGIRPRKKIFSAPPPPHRYSPNDLPPPAPPPREPPPLPLF